MTNDLDLRQGGAVARFDPDEAKAHDAKADALIDYARKVKDWPLLEQAIDAKLDNQREFVAWWDANVSAGKGGDRRSENQTRRSVHLVSMTDAEQQTAITHQAVSKWRRRLAQPAKYRDMLFGVTWAKAMAETVTTTAAQWTGDPESYTPSQYIEAARAVMGGIDLDPASNAFAQQTVQAAKWHSEEDDGLKQPWHGRVFLNPPYKHPLVAQFIDRLCDEVDAAHVTQAILLTNNNTDTRWWHKAAFRGAGVCFTRGRINFYKADGEITQPTNGQTFFYFGDEWQAFCSVFSRFGLVMVVPV